MDRRHKHTFQFTVSRIISQIVVIIQLFCCSARWHLVGVTVCGLECTVCRRMSHSHQLNIYDDIPTINAQSRGTKNLV